MTSMGEILDIATKHEAAKAAAIESRASEHARDERLQLAVAALSSPNLVLKLLGPNDMIQYLLAPIAAWVQTGEVT